MVATSVITGILSNIPWGKVVDNAPKIADSAVKLWDTVTSRKKQDSVPDEQLAAKAEANPCEADLLNARLLVVEESIRSLQDQMQASSELIKALAEQNTQLVQRIELNRIRFVRYAVASGAGGTVLLAVVMYVLLRH